ncbi:CD226 antigen-like [Hyperolius riggenbachi]|uniref:CD226 antigen-like n=1 Tax=Hyperolius riggenbachi TaxID=752182 RepID=UPI0035A2D74D
MDWMERYVVLTCVLSSVWMTVAAGDDIRAVSAESKFGESATLKCTLLNQKSFLQVSWKKVVGDKSIAVASFSPSSGAQVEKSYANRLNITTWGSNQTAITVYKAYTEDEGCYTCVFHIFPTGSKQDQACLKISGEVLTEKYHKVRSGAAVTMKCTLRGSHNVLQASWKKNEEKIASYVPNRTTIEPQYEKKLTMSMEKGSVSTITIGKATINDEGEYTCLFSVFPTGSKLGKTYLYVCDPASLPRPGMTVLSVTLISVITCFWW